MQECLFILGRDPELSVLEIVSYLKRKQIDHELVEFNKLAALFQLPKPANLASVISHLGGTIKIASRINSVKDISFASNKVTYGVMQIKGDASRLLKQLHAFFKEERIKAVRKYASLESIPPKKSSRLDLEMIVFRDKIFRVVAVSSPKQYKQRDATRPVFDPLKVTSIRLAKMLINLAQSKEEILDPFCGTGTILQEALLMGYRVFGIDKNINEAKENIAWLGDQYASRFQLFAGDATRSSSFIDNIEAIVTEPYLGPYIKKMLTREQALVIKKSLENLYCKFLENTSTIVQGKIVIVIPRFRTFSGTVALDFEGILKRVRLRCCSPIKEIKTPVLYKYKRSKIERLIYILEKAW